MTYTCYGDSVLNPYPVDECAKRGFASRARVELVLIRAQREREHPHWRWCGGVDVNGKFYVVQCRHLEHKNKAASG